MNFAIFFALFLTTGAAAFTPAPTTCDDQKEPSECPANLTARLYSDQRASDLNWLDQLRRNLGTIDDARGVYKNCLPPKYQDFNSANLSPLAQSHGLEIIQDSCLDKVPQLHATSVEKNAKRYLARIDHLHDNIKLKSAILTNMVDIEKYRQLLVPNSAEPYCYGTSFGFNQAVAWCDTLKNCSKPSQTKEKILSEIKDYQENLDKNKKNISSLQNTIAEKNAHLKKLYQERTQKAVRNQIRVTEIDAEIKTTNENIATAETTLNKLQEIPLSLIPYIGDVFHAAKKAGKTNDLALEEQLKANLKSLDSQTKMLDENASCLNRHYSIVSKSDDPFQKDYTCKNIDANLESIPDPILDPTINNDIQCIKKERKRVKKAEGIVDAAALFIAEETAYLAAGALTGGSIAAIHWANRARKTLKAADNLQDLSKAKKIWSALKETNIPNESEKKALMSISAKWVFASKTAVVSGFTAFNYQQMMDEVKLACNEKLQYYLNQTQSPQNPNLITCPGEVPPLTKAYHDLEACADAKFTQRLVTALSALGLPGVGEALTRGVSKAAPITRASDDVAAAAARQTDELNRELSRLRAMDQAQLGTDPRLTKRITELEEQIAKGTARTTDDIATTAARVSDDAAKVATSAVPKKTILAVILGGIGLAAFDKFGGKTPENEPSQPVPTTENPPSEGSGDTAANDDKKKDSDKKTYSMYLDFSSGEAVCKIEGELGEKDVSWTHVPPENKEDEDEDYWDEVVASGAASGKDQELALPDLDDVEGIHRYEAKIGDEKIAGCAYGNPIEPYYDDVTPLSPPQPFPPMMNLIPAVLMI